MEALQLAGILLCQGQLNQADLRSLQGDKFLQALANPAQDNEALLLTQRGV